MDIRKSTTTGVLFWTPAPVRTSTPSSVISEDEWDHEEEEQGTESDDDFASQMDENGIIGLSEALEDVELGETYGDAYANNNPDLDPRPLTPEEEGPTENERELSESHTESSSAEDVMLSLCHNLMGNLTDEQGGRFLPERDKYLDITQERKDGEEVERKSYRKKKKKGIGTMNCLVESHLSKGVILNTSSTPSCSAHLPAMENSGVSHRHCLVSEPTSSVTPTTFPHLLHFTAEEIAAAPGIEAETLPDMSSTESLTGSHCSATSPMSSPRYPKTKLKASPQPATLFTDNNIADDNSRVTNRPLEGLVKSDRHHKQPDPSPSKPRQHSPVATCSRTHPNTVRTDYLKFKHQTTSPDRELRTPRAMSNTAEVDKSSKGPLSYRTPDFSKVEPRVRFPKGGYTPPKSRRSPKSESLSHKPPLVFKSPADIIKEVLLDTTDGSPAPSDSYRPPTTSAPTSIVPQEFRCQHQAAILYETLQKDYDRLLTKNAEAENTIDRLRLEAKVNLYSDPPKPGHLVQSGLNQGSSKVMMLDFPQAQRAEINSSLHPNRHSPHQKSSPASSTRSPGPQVGQQLAKILYSQADQFLQQLQTFDDLLNSRKLKLCELKKGVSQLSEGLNSLERGYLLARDEHKLLQQQGADIGHFDPERELEGLIFQCVLCMDELKEQVEQMRQEQPTCEAPPSPRRHLTPLSVPSEGGETHPQSPPEPSLVDPGEVVPVEVCSASGESDEETLNSLYLKPVDGKQKCVEQGFSKLMDHYQSFEELPKSLDQRQKDGAPLSAAVRTDMQPGSEEKVRLNRGTGNLEVQQRPLQRLSDHQDSHPAHTRKQQTSRSSPPSGRASIQSTTLPVPPPSSRRSIEMGKSQSSSLSSLGEITASERRNSKLKPGINRVLSQDGIISPEMDSGFVGSESSRLTPAAAPSPLHQRASETVSVPRQENAGNPQRGQAAAPCPASSPTHSCMDVDPREVSRLSTDRPRRSRRGQRRRMFSCSPRRRICQSEQSRADSWTSQSDSTVSEDGQNDRYTESVNSIHSSSSSSSPAARYDYGNSLRALSSTQLANRNAALQTLQAEVSGLKERLESCLRNQKPLSSVRAAPSPHINISTSRIRSGERWDDVSRGRRDRQAADEVEESTMRRTVRRSPTSAHRAKPQPDVLSDSEPSTPQPPPLVSRSTQTSAAAPESRCSHTDTVRSRANTRQHPGVSQTADEPDSRSRKAPLCLQCLSRRQGKPEIKPVAGSREPPHSSHCPHCLLWGCPESNRTTEPDCRRVSDSPKHTSCQPAQFPPDSVRSKYFTAAAPPAPLHCMPVCPQPLLFYPLPLYESPNDSSGTSSGVRGHREAKVRTRRSPSPDRQLSVDTSLSRAIRAARHMKHTSGHMARSLATGLHYQELLTQSCSH
uniref:microtubule organization protein AKNA n=1 Tax=Semicossyphus pulcher TaxID=241346 RepID=UPI0037E754DA